MGETHFMRQVDSIAGTGAEAGGGPLSDAVQGEDGRFFKWRWEKCAGRVGFVVLGEDVSLFVSVTESLAHLARQVQLPLRDDLIQLGSELVALHPVQQRIVEPLR